MGVLPSIPSLNDFKLWLSSSGKSTLYDISNWNKNDTWERWNLGEVPPLLRDEDKKFLMAISGNASVHPGQKEGRSWGKEGFIVKTGYKQLLERCDIPTKSAIWKEMWSPNNLPKINIFCWQLAHNKLLTGENLKKKGYMGSFRCVL